MTQTLIATKTFKGRVVERKFTEYEWGLLGNDTNGWVKKTDQVVLASIPLPPKGETKQIIIADPKPAEIVIEDVKQTIKNDFMTAASKLSKGNIKDYFDANKIIYSNAANIIEIRTQLASVLNYDIKKLNEAFNK